MSPDVLVERLRVDVFDERERAALELLIWHGVWVERLAQGLEGGRFVEQEGEMAVIRWKDLERYVREPHRYRREEIHVLRVAASLAAGTPVYLKDVLEPAMGPAVRRAMVEAFAAAAGVDVTG